MLTEKIIRDARGEGKARTIWDRQVTGLGLQITQGGKKNLVLRYKVAGKKRQAILCRAGELPLKEVRKLAGETLVRIRAGDPHPLERARRARIAPTVAQGLDRFFSEFIPGRSAIGRMTERTVRDYRQQTRQCVRPVLGGLRVEAVTRRDVEHMVEPLTPVRRNRVLAFTSRLFSVFEEWEWRPQNSNPCRGVERAREEPRDRTLSADELQALAVALRDVQARFPGPVAAIRFAALTGLRIGEVIAIRWEHVDLASGRLLLPSTKTGRRWHDLPEPALVVLEGLPRINAWPFTSGRPSPLTYRTVQQHFARIAQEAGLEDVRLHDLRRTVMTAAAAAGVGTYVLRDLLGHKTTAMADRYVRAVGNPVREAREQVGAAVAAMMDDTADNGAPDR